MRKSLRIGALALSLLMVWGAFTGCQPTPDHELVKQKDTDKLIEMAVGVDETSSPEAEQKEPVLPLVDRFGERFVCDITLSSGASIKVDVPITYMAEDKFPLVRVEKGYPDSDVVVGLCKRLLHSDTLYIHESAETRESIQERMDYIAARMVDEEVRQEIIESDGEEYYNEVFLPSQQQRYRELQAAYEQAPSGSSDIFILWEGEIPDGGLVNLVSSPEDFRARRRVDMYVSWWSKYDDGQNDIRFSCEYKDSWGYHILKTIEDFDTPEEGFTTTPQQAVDMALALFEGLMDVKVQTVLLCDNGDDVTPATQTGYVIRLSPVYAGAGLGYLFGAAQGEELEGGYAPLWWHETMEVTVTDEGIAGFEWRDALKVQEVLTEEVNLLSVEEIQPLFQQQMKWKYALNKSVEVTEVTMGLMRISEKFNLENGLLTPVWIFTGDVGIDTGSGVVYEDQTLCIINAVDGTILTAGQDY